MGSGRARDRARAALLDRLGIALPRLTVVTIQGLAFHVVGERYEQLGYEAPPRVLSASEQRDRVRELLEHEDADRWPVYGGLLSLRGFADEVRQFVIRAQEALLPPDEIDRRAKERGLAGWSELAAFLRHYLAVLDASKEVDFAGLVEQAAAAVGEGDRPFDHVIVDDYQDTTFGAERLLAELRTRASSSPATSVPTCSRSRGRRTCRSGGSSRATRGPPRSSSTPRIGRGRRRSRPGGRPTCPSSTPRSRARSGGSTSRSVFPGATSRSSRGGTAPTRPGCCARSTTPTSRARSPSAGRTGSPPRRDRSCSRSGGRSPEPEERDALAEPVLTSELGGLSPASARTLLRLVRAHGLPARESLGRPDLGAPEEAAGITELGAVLAEAESHDGSVLRAFEALWRGLPYARELVRRAEIDHHARLDLDAVLQLSRAVSEAGSSPDPSVEAFLLRLGSEDADELAAGVEAAEDAIHVLTAHAATGRGFDTVVVVDALEGDFPSLSRPEPMFDLGALDGTSRRSEINRLRLADERRLFAMVCSRARRRVLFTATDPHGDQSGVTLRSRFVEELAVEWTDAPSTPFVEPVSVAEAASAWRRVLADPKAPGPDRLSSLDGLLALGDDPARWWFQRDWTDLEAEPRDTLYLFSRLGTLENCELQYVLSSELGLDPGGGYQAWVGHLVHRLIEDCERGEVERTREAFERALDERWEPSRFPSFAISEAERANAKRVLIPNWFARYAAPAATATEQSFEFDFEGAAIRGKIDRIGPGPDGATRITDYKTGRSDNAPSVREPAARHLLPRRRRHGRPRPAPAGRRGRARVPRRQEEGPDPRRPGVADHQGRGGGLQDPDARADRDARRTDPRARPRPPLRREHRGELFLLPVPAAVHALPAGRRGLPDPRDRVERRDAGGRDAGPDGARRGPPARRTPGDETTDGPQQLRLVT